MHTTHSTLLRDASREGDQQLKAFDKGVCGEG
jgi:hypothetical protein